MRRSVYRSRYLAGAWFCFLAQCALHEETAAAQPIATRDGPPIHLDVQPCDGDVSSAEVAHLAALELRAQSVEAANHSPMTTTVRVQCEGDRAQIFVFDPLTQKSLARAIDLDAVPAQSRSRLLALAVAELVAASWIELESNDAPVAMPRPPARGPEPRDGQRPSAAAIAWRMAREPREGAGPSWHAVGLVTGLWFPLDPAPLLGVGVGVGVDPYESAGIDVDVIGVHGSSSFALGKVTSDIVCVGASLRLTRSIGRFVLHTGPGLRLGFARLSGVPISSAIASGHTVEGGWAAPTASVGASYAPGRRLALEWAFEAGYVLVPVRGSIDNARDVGAYGTLLGMHLGAGWLF